MYAKITHKYIWYAVGFLGLLSLYGAQQAFALTMPAMSAVSFEHDLTVGNDGQEVAALQDFLIAGGFLSLPAGVTAGHFGPLTESALAKYQASIGVLSTGYFGPITRGRITALLVNSQANPKAVSGASMMNSGIAGIHVDILSTPETWDEQYTHSITWSSFNIDPTSTVTITLNKNKQFDSVIAKKVPNTGKYDFTLPNPMSNYSKYSITVTSDANPAITDTTDSYFLAKTINRSGSARSSSGSSSSGNDSKQNVNPSPSSSSSPSPSSSGHVSYGDSVDFTASVISVLEQYLRILSGK